MSIEKVLYHDLDSEPFERPSISTLELGAGDRYC
jgi:hypothetical protein